MVKTSTMVTVTSVAAVTGLVGYAVYFDYKRRNDPSFRRQLRKDRRKAEKIAQASAPKTYDPATITNADLDRVLNELKEEAAELENTPLEGRHELFINKVGEGEALVMQGPSYYMQAAAAFFQATKFYPVPRELLGIFERTQPPQVYGLIVRLLARDLETMSDLPTGTRAGGRATSPSQRRSPRARSPPHGDAILEEIVPPTSSTTPAPAPAPAPTSISTEPTSSAPSTTSTEPTIQAPIPSSVPLAPTSVPGTTATTTNSTSSTTGSENLASATASADSSPIAISHASFDPTTPPVIVSVPASEAGEEDVLSLSESGVHVVHPGHEQEDKEEKEEASVQGSTASVGEGVGVVDLEVTAGESREDEEKVLREAQAENAGPGEGVGA